MSAARLVVVGLPGEKRTVALLDAAARAGVEAVCVAWGAALASPDSVGARGRPGDILRVESPGGDASTWRAIAARGGYEGSHQAGEWRPGRHWFRGLSSFLRELDRATPHLYATHPSAQVLAMTDKQVCQERLAEAGVPTPERLPEVSGADGLREQMRALGYPAVYVKPRWGSSGAGVLAYRCAGERELLISTAGLAHGRLHNHKRLRRYAGRSEIDTLLDTVLRDGAVVQRWLPKAGHERGPLDLRVLVLRGRVAQSVARVGRGTITNLHLDALRMEPEQALAAFRPTLLGDVHAVCQKAAACFPGHHAVGVDVMVDTRGRPYVLECNAWGDYLPRLLVDGLSSYDLYLQGLLEQGASSRSSS